MNIHANTTGGALVVKVEDSRIDAAVALEFKEAVRECVDGAPERIVLDLTDVDFIDSSGLGAIVATKKMAATAHTLELAGLSPTVDKVFRLTRMDRVFKIHPRIEDLDLAQAS